MLSFLTTLLIGVLSLSTAAYAQTQQGMNQECGVRMHKAEATLANLEKELSQNYDEEFMVHYKNSQNAWLAYRATQLKMRYPTRDWGSIQPLCECEYQISLIENRVKEMKEWINGAEEGDVCSGTVHVKH